MNTTQAKAKSETCSQCKHWAQHEDGRMATHGSCAMRDAYRYSHRDSPCLFTPERFDRKPA